MAEPAWRNLGPVSRRKLAEAGIFDRGHLQALGAAAAWWQVKRVWPEASLNLLWALQGALEDLPWQQVAKEQRLSLLLALEAAKPADMD